MAIADPTLSENVLQGLICPNCCASAEKASFGIEATVTLLQVIDDGTGDYVDASWDENSRISCTMCHHDGTVAEFSIVDPSIMECTSYTHPRSPRLSVQHDDTIRLYTGSLVDLADFLQGFEQEVPATEYAIITCAPCDRRYLTPGYLSPRDRSREPNRYPSTH